MIELSSIDLPLAQISQIFQHNSNFTTFTATDSRIRRLPHVSEQLSVLRIIPNPLSQQTMCEISAMNNLRELNLSNCGITQFDVTQLTNLAILDLSRNAIHPSTLIDVLQLQNLQDFNMSRCGIAAFPASESSIQILDVSCNRIQNLDNVFGLTHLAELTAADVGLEALPVLFQNDILLKLDLRENRVENGIKLLEISHNLIELRLSAGSAMADCNFQNSAVQTLHLERFRLGASVVKMICDLQFLKTVVLTSSNLTDIPQFREGLEELDMSFQDIITVKAHIFTMKSLKRLNLERCCIRRIDQFDTDECFLEHLNLLENIIDIASCQLVSGITTLKTLKLSCQPLQNQFYKQMVGIDMASSKIESITMDQIYCDASPLSELKHLKSITFNSCELFKCPASLDNTWLAEFSLRGSSYHDAKFVPLLFNVSCIKKLNLAYCYINEIPNVSADSQIADLSLFSARFQAASITRLSVLKLQKLNLSQCSLATIPNINLERLTSLTLSGNKIPPGDLRPFLASPVLTFLDVSDCGLSELPWLSSDKCALSSLQTLVAHNNSFTSFKNVVVAFSLPHVRDLKQYLSRFQPKRWRCAQLPNHQMLDVTEDSDVLRLRMCEIVKTTKEFEGEHTPLRAEAAKVEGQWDQLRQTVEEVLYNVERGATQ